MFLSSEPFRVFIENNSFDWLSLIAILISLLSLFFTFWKRRTVFAIDITKAHIVQSYTWHDGMEINVFPDELHIHVRFGFSNLSDSPIIYTFNSFLLVGDNQIRLGHPTYSINDSPEQNAIGIKYLDNEMQSIFKLTSSEELTICGGLDTKINEFILSLDEFPNSQKVIDKFKESYIMLIVRVKKKDNLSIGKVKETKFNDYSFKIELKDIITRYEEYINQK